MSKFPLPESTIASHLAVLGKTGSGKTSTAKLIVEHVVDEGHRVCVLDPIKSDWWGLTSSASGKRSGLPFEILGGPRGYVPLHPTSGKVIGELVASGKLPLSILDMANFKAGEHQRFFIEFAETLMRKMRGVLYLVIEEAHEFAPKERSGIGNENMAIYLAKKLATAGRSKGIRLILASQRTQALHNALLGSCETMIVHRMTSPADQEPVKKWLKGNVADKAVLASIDAGMSSLTTGSAWVVSGEASFFEQVKFPLFRTFDNNAAPKKGSGSDVHVSATYDVEKLRALIGEAVAEADAIDPAKLQARIRELEKQLKAKPPAAEPDAKMISGIEEAAEARGWARGTRNARVKIAARLRHFADKVDEGMATPDVEPIASHHATFIQHIDASIKERAPARVKVIPESTESRKARSQNGEVSLQPAHFKVLEGLAMLAGIGMRAPPKPVLGGATGYAHKGGGFQRVLTHLSGAGLIEYRNGGVALTDAGEAIAPAPSGGTIRERLRTLTQPAHEKIIEALVENNGFLTKQDLAQATNYEAKGGGFQRVLTHLSGLKVITYESGGVVLAPWVTA